MSLSLFQQLLSPFDDEESQPSATERTDYSYYLQQQQRLYHQRVKRKQELFNENVKNYEFFNQLDSYLENQLYNSPSPAKNISNVAVAHPIRFIEPFPQDFETDEYNIIFKKNCVEMREYTRFSIGQMLHKSNQQIRPNPAPILIQRKEEWVILENEALKQQFGMLKQEMIQYLLLPNPTQQTKEKLLHLLLDYQFPKTPQIVNTKSERAYKEEKDSSSASTASTSSQSVPIPTIVPISNNVKLSHEQDNSPVYKEEENEKVWKKTTNSLSKSNTKRKKNQNVAKAKVDSNNSKNLFQDQDEFDNLDLSTSLSKPSISSNYAQWILLEQQHHNFTSFVGEE